MRKRVLPVLAVALSFILGAACGDDEITQPDNLPMVVGCAQDCFDAYEAIFEGLVHVLKKVDEPEAYELPAGITLDLLTGAFAFGLDLDNSPGVDSELEGVVEAGVASDCTDGMQLDEECDFEWLITLALNGDTTAAGVNRATDLGLAPPPDETPVMRFSLGPDPTALVVSDECGFIITSFSTILQLWDPATPVTSVSVQFDTYYGAQTMRGYIDWSGGSTSEGSLLVEYQGREYDCTFNIETFAIDCPE